MMLLMLVILLLHGSPSFCEEEENLEDMEDMLSADTVDEKTVDLAETDPYFVFYFSPWSRFCRRMAYDWEELASRHNKEQNRKITIGKTDCTLAADFCNAQNISGFPTLKLYTTGFERGEVIKYQGKREIFYFEKFIQE